MHRSQKDPLAADEDAPQRVLVPISLRDEKVNGDAASCSKTNTSKVSSTLFSLLFQQCYLFIILTRIQPRKRKRKPSLGSSMMMTMITCSISEMFPRQLNGNWLKITRILECGRPLLPKGFQYE